MGGGQGEAPRGHKVILPLIVNPEAEADLADAKAYYDQRSPGLGDDFILCVEEVFDRLQRTPGLYAKVFQDLRLALIRRFPYAVIYRIDEEQVTVVAVYHTRRDPRWWQERA
jgi:plasmid stabilization system protein ParE